LNIPNESWSSTNFGNKASAPFEGMLYSMAWLGMELQRDGTSTLIFYPPLTKYQFLLCRGKWKTSPTDPNTVIIDTKTPVGYATLRVKVMDLQTKDNVAMIRAYVDVGDRVMMIDFFNGGSVLEGGSPTEFPDLRNMGQAWFDGMQVSRQPIDKALFNNTAWEMSPYSSESESKFEIPQLAIRTTFVNDFLTKTPSLVYGAKFNFAQDGNVYIDIPSVVKETAFRPWASQVEDKNIMVRGTWRTRVFAHRLEQHINRQATPLDGDWHVWAIEFDGQKVRYYLDGKLIPVSHYTVDDNTTVDVIDRSRTDESGGYPSTMPDEDFAKLNVNRQMLDQVFRAKGPWYFILNDYAEWEDKLDPPRPTDPFPVQTTLIDYVRLYQKN